jgi:hypothetical protein
MPGMHGVTLRPIRREDACAYASFIDRIDATDLRRRFFHPTAAYTSCRQYGRFYGAAILSRIGTRSESP